MQYDVVIAGGGFAGAYCANALAKAFGRDSQQRVALIAERNVLVFQPMLAEVVGSSLSPSDVVNPLRLYCKKVTVLQGAISRVDWASRQLDLDGGRFTRNHKVGFKHLVLALGTITDLAAVPGMKEYGWPMKSLTDALRLRTALINRLEEANLVEDVSVKNRLMSFVVVGGGYTGVETAGQIFDFVTEAKRFYSNLKQTLVRVILIHSQSQLLGDIGVDLGAYATQVLRERGIEVRLGTRVTEVTATRVHMDTSDPIEANTVVSSIGSAPNPIVVDLCHQLKIETQRGRIPVEATMQVGGVNNLWAIGDCAAVPWNDRGTVKLSPPTAQLAVRQGIQLGQNIGRCFANQPLKPFTYRYMGQLAAIGDRRAVAEVFGLHFKGIFAWWMWRTIYLAKLPGVLRRLRVTIDWTFELIFPRDISILLPSPDDTFRAIHLEKGETLFEAGEFSRAFFLVRRGSLSLSYAGGEPVTLKPNDVIQQETVDAQGKWNATVKALESSDVVVMRGRARDLLSRDLKLIRR